jgi:predicted RNase H-like HicB family nuclease
MDEARSNIREVIELLLGSYREQAFQHASPGVVREMVTVDGNPSAT